MVKMPTDMVSMRKGIYIYIYTHIHTYIYTYIHICTYICVGIKNNMVEMPTDLVSMPKGGPESQTVVLSPISDEFYR